jgi:delta 1-pyrroline-5-carboxylate dehydrogenase
MIEDGRVNFVSFTGSVEGGCAVQRAAARRFIHTNLELGGKDPAYVRPDAPLNSTIENLVDGAFFNAGQSCCAVERIYVHRDVYRPFVEGVVALTRQYRLGNPLAPDTTLGPMVRASAAELVRSQITEAIAQGARALIAARDFPADRAGTLSFAKTGATFLSVTIAASRELRKTRQRPDACRASATAGGAVAAQTWRRFAPRRPCPTCPTRRGFEERPPKQSISVAELGTLHGAFEHRQS